MAASSAATFILSMTRRRDSRPSLRAKEPIGRSTCFDMMTMANFAKFRVKATTRFSLSTLSTRRDALLKQGALMAVAFATDTILAGGCASEQTQADTSFGGAMTRRTAPFGQAAKTGFGAFALSTEREVHA